MKKVISLAEYNPNKVRQLLKACYTERFFRLFCSQIEFEGESVGSNGKFYAKRMLWELGTFAISKSKVKLAEETLLEAPKGTGSGDHADEAVITDYSQGETDLYNQTATASLISKKDSQVIQEGVLTANKDFVICYVNSEARYKKGCSVMNTAMRYISRMVNAGMTINTNLMLHKMPWAVKCLPEEENGAKELVKQIANDEIVAFFESEVNLDSVSLSVPYIIDKLGDYETRLQNEFLTELGVDNSKTLSSGQDRLNMDEVNANNATINAFARDMKNEFEDFNDRVEKALGIDFKIKLHEEETLSVHEEINDKDPTGQAEKPDEEGGEE